MCIDTNLPKMVMTRRMTRAAAGGASSHRHRVTKRKTVGRPRKTGRKTGHKTSHHGYSGSVATRAYTKRHSRALRTYRKKYRVKRASDVRKGLRKRRHGRGLCICRKTIHSTGYRLYMKHHLRRLKADGHKITHALFSKVAHHWKRLTPQTKHGWEKRAKHVPVHHVTRRCRCKRANQARVPTQHRLHKKVHRGNNAWVKFVKKYARAHPGHKLNFKSLAKAYKNRH